MEDFLVWKEKIRLEQLHQISHPAVDSQRPTSDSSQVYIEHSELKRTLTSDTVSIRKYIQEMVLSSEQIVCINCIESEKIHDADEFQNY